MTSPRQEQLLREAARMFAEYGYHGVSIEDLGASVGISGPAVYKHFASKDQLLADLLVGISEDLLEGGRAEVAGARSPADALERLVDRHLAFSLSEPDLIRVQDRDLASLSPSDAHSVRRFQRAYVELWVDQLVPPLTRPEARARAHAVFGLLNSTPHLSEAADYAPVLRTMALAALRS
ncbi:MAG TPA: TetR/AcrR family transcriptional regulator [Mycobacteriales bacterium]|nr:TetR/AcrR family transcriptional regulator [Mycobacteriales bacterium]